MERGVERGGQLPGSPRSPARRIRCTGRRRWHPRYAARVSRIGPSAYRVDPEVAVTGSPGNGMPWLCSGRTFEPIQHVRQRLAGEIVSAPEHIRCRRGIHPEHVHGGAEVRRAGRSTFAAACCGHRVLDAVTASSLPAASGLKPSCRWPRPVSRTSEPAA